MDEELRIREGEPLRIRRGVQVIPMLSVDIPVEFKTVEAEQTQKTYMLKFTCPNGCLNAQGKVLTVRMTQANASVGVQCGGCGAAMAPPTTPSVDV